MTVIDILRAAAPAFANECAIIDGDDSSTHAELWDRVDRLSQGLLGLGVAKGDVLAAWLPNCHEAIESELAAFQIGAIWVTLNAQMTWPEVCGVIASTDPKAIITSTELRERMDPGDSATPYNFRHATILVTGSANGYEALMERATPTRPSVHVAENDIARLRYTSGTTGRAKAAILTHRVYLASLEVQQRQLHPLSTVDRVLHAAPLTHASGALIYPILAAGGANVIVRRFDTEEVLEAIERLRITTMFVVPAILQRMTQSPSFAVRDLSSLRTITYGGAPIAMEKLTAAMQRLRGILVQIYGLTEALHPVTALPREEHWIGNPKLGSIGRATHINEVRIVDSEFRELPDGEVGEIAICGRNVMSGYWRDEEETAKVLHDGWLLSGDLGYRDAEGYFFIVDRKKDVVISGGFNVYTTEVERVLSDHPAIAEAAVFGIPSDEWGEAVHAVVVPKEGEDVEESELLAHCKRLLSRYKIPKAIEIRIEPLPKSGAGKIAKSGLREAFWTGYERRVH